MKFLLLTKVHLMCRSVQVAGPAAAGWRVSTNPLAGQIPSLEILGSWAETDLPKAQKQSPFHAFFGAGWWVGAKDPPLENQLLEPFGIFN